MINKKQVEIGTTSLALGTLHYLTQREWDTLFTAPFKIVDKLFFGGNLEVLAHQAPNYSGVLEGSMPAFFGSLGFTAVFSGFGHPARKFRYATEVFLGYTCLEYMQSSSVAGYFDFKDVVMYGVGACLGYSLSRITENRPLEDKKIRKGPKNGISKRSRKK